MAYGSILRKFPRVRRYRYYSIFCWFFIKFFLSKIRLYPQYPFFAFPINPCLLNISLSCCFIGFPICCISFILFRNCLGLFSHTLSLISCTNFSICSVFSSLVCYIGSFLLSAIWMFLLLAYL